MNSGARGRVVMLAGNDAVADSRVIKEAEALAAAGHETIVLCLQSDRCHADAKQNGVIYRRLPPSQPSTLPWSRPKGWSAKPQTRAVEPGTPLAIESLAEATKVPATAPGLTYRADRRPLVERAGRRALHLARKLVRKAVHLTRRSVRKAVHLTRRSVRKAVHLIRTSVRKIAGYGRRAALHAHRRRTQTRHYSGAAYRDAVLGELLALAPDVVHAHDLVTLATAKDAKRRLGCRVVYDAHELETERNANYPTWAWRVVRRTERRLIGHCDGVITVSGRIAAHLAELYNVPRPAVVYNSPAIRPPDVDGGAVQPDLREHLGVAADESVAVYVGSITVGRGLAVAVCAIARLPESFHLALVGPLRPATHEELEELCRSLGVRERVHFVPPVPPADVVPFIRGADLSLSLIEDVCLSYRYCMPNKLFESVFAGVPVLASDLPEMADFLLRTGTGRVVDVADIDAVAAAIHAMCTSERIVIGPDQRRALEAAWGWPAQAAQLRELYAGLLPERRGS